MDYRKSHLDPGKGLTYDASFNNLPYRKVVWQWEQGVLWALVKKIQAGGKDLAYLDFACGTGRIVSLLEAFMNESYGVDVSESMLRIACDRVIKSKLIQCDLTKDNYFPEEKFDVVTAFRFLLNAQLELKEDVLKVIRKIIKKDGFFIFNIHMNKGCFLDREIKLYRWLRKIKGLDYNSMSIEETKSLVEKAGFVVTEMHHFGVIPIYSEKHRFLLRQIELVEHLLSRSPILQPISQQIIYVCRPS